MTYHIKMTLPMKQIQEDAPFKLPHLDHHVEMHFLCQAEIESNDEWLQWKREVK